MKEFVSVLKDRKITLTQAVKDIQTHFLPEKAEIKEYYQRLYKVSTGELKELYTEEEEAIKRYLFVLKNPALIASTFYKIGSYSRKINQVEKAIRSGVYNIAAMKSTVKELKKLSYIDDL